MWQTIIKDYITLIITLTSLIIFGRIVLNEHKNKTLINRVLLFCLVCTIHAIILNVFDNTLKSLIMFIINVIYCKYRFSISMKKSIFLMFLYMILMIITEMIEILFNIKILGMSSDYLYNSLAGSIIASICVFILLIVITYLLRKILTKLINIKIENNIKLIIYFVLTFICIIFLFYKAFMNLKIDLSFFITVFIFFAFLIILFSLIKQIIDNNQLTKQYDNLLEFMTTFEMEIEKQRIQRHETKNELLTIRAKLCDNQKNNEIVNYIDEILEEKIKVKQEEYAKFGYLPANGIKGLCYFKVQEAENKGINIALNISKKIKASPINNLNNKEQKEFGRILGVLLDNAIEASLDSKDKKIGIEFYSKSKQDFKMIISNTYSNKIDKDKIGKEIFSTKGKNRGHGLLLVKHIINNNSLFDLNTEVRNNLYIQTISIKKV